MGVDIPGVVIADAAAFTKFLTEREAEYAILGAVVGAILATLGLWLFESRKERARRRDAAADYVRRMADHLGRMADHFEKQEIPTVDGRAFDGLLFGFEDLVSPFMTPDVKDRLINLKSMSSAATQFDRDLSRAKSWDDLKPETKAGMPTWISVARKLNGDLLAAAEHMRNERSVGRRMLSGRLGSSKEDVA